MELTIKWKDKAGEWQTFDISDIMHQSRSHALSLFNQGTAVIIKQDDDYIVNKQELYDRYLADGKKVRMIAHCKASDKPIRDVGFIA